MLTSEDSAASLELELAADKPFSLYRTTVWTSVIKTYFTVRFLVFESDNHRSNIYQHLNVDISCGHLFCSLRPYVSQLLFLVVSAIV